MTIVNILTTEYLTVALAARQARRELEAAVLAAESALREMAR